MVSEDMVQADSVPAVSSERSTIPQIHGSIVKAVCLVKAHVDAVKKSQYNKHGGYHFASTDDIFAAVMRRMGEVGLMCLPLELKNERVTIDVPDKDRNGALQYDKFDKLITKKSHWISAEIGFLLATAEATWFDPLSKRSEFIQYTGPQTAQGVVSFAEKAYLRSLFKLPTGDMDVDSMNQADTIEDQVALNSNVKRKSSSGAKKDGTDKVFNEIKEKVIAATGNRPMLLQIRQLYAEEWQQLPARWVEILDNEYEDALSSCREAAE